MKQFVLRSSRNNSTHYQWPRWVWFWKLCVINFHFLARRGEDFDSLATAVDGSNTFAVSSNQCQNQNFGNICGIAWTTPRAWVSWTHLEVHLIFHLQTRPSCCQWRCALLCPWDCCIWWEHDWGFQQTRRPQRGEPQEKCLPTVGLVLEGEPTKQQVQGAS